MKQDLLTQLELAQTYYSATVEELNFVYSLPLPKLLGLAQRVHEKKFNQDEIQFCTLLSIKTGGCKEDCAYCPQSAKYKTEIDAHALLDIEEIKQAAIAAKNNGSTRFCMGAAWRSPPKKGKQFDSIVDAVKEVSSMGLEVCVTLGMLDEEQAKALKHAGVYAYNHNIDTSPEYYSDIISTRNFSDRLKTLENVRKAGMTVCCGGIVGMGESKIDRLKMLQVLNNLNPHPESVPINLLIKIPGTPLEGVNDIDVFDLIRTIATARVFLPHSRVRLSAGRSEMSDETQALCFVAGANSVFTGEKLLTAENPELKKDLDLLNRLGMKISNEVQQVELPHEILLANKNPEIDSHIRS